MFSVVILLVVSGCGYLWFVDLVSFGVGVLISVLFWFDCVFVDLLFMCLFDYCCYRWLFLYYWLVVYD